jgi:hypothetical protein
MINIATKSGGTPNNTNQQEEERVVGSGKAPGRFFSFRLCC